MSEKFRRGSESSLSKLCCALGGISINIEEPSSTEVPNSSSYYNRKGFFSLCVQVMCDSFYRETFFSCISPGSTHESTAYAMSTLFHLLSTDRYGLPGVYWVAGDDEKVFMDAC